MSSQNVVNFGEATRAPESGVSREGEARTRIDSAESGSGRLHPHQRSFHQSHRKSFKKSKSSKHLLDVPQERPLFCKRFPEPDKGEWPVRWSPSREADATEEAERLLNVESHGGAEATLVETRRRWSDAYFAVIAMVRAKRLWRRLDRREKRDVLLEWAGMRAKDVEDEITKQIQKAKVDKGLEVPGRKLREVPPEILRLSRNVAGAVKRMALQDNRIEYLPPELFTRYTDLNTLRLSNNRIPAIPSTIRLLTSLQMLIIGDNDLCILPPALGDLVSLHTLHVQGNKRIQRLPLEMGKLHHSTMGGCLKDITFDRNRVKYPPLEAVDQGLNVACDLMRRVWDSGESGRLVLSGMGLATLPPYICDVPMATCITELNIFQNKITRLPPAMGLLTSLELLRLDEAHVVFPNQHLMKQSDALRDPETRMIQVRNRVKIGMKRRGMVC